MTPADARAALHRAADTATDEHAVTLARIAAMLPGVAAAVALTPGDVEPLGAKGGEFKPRAVPPDTWAHSLLGSLVRAMRRAG